MSFKVIFKLLNSPSERAFTTNNIYLGETHLISSRQMRDLGSNKSGNPSDQEELWLCQYLPQIHSFKPNTNKEKEYWPLDDMKPNVLNSMKTIYLS